MRTAFTPLLLLLALSVHAQTWMPAPSMSTARSGAAAVVLDGRLVVMGGRDASGAPLTTAEAFDPVTGWTALPPLRRARADAAAAVLDGRIVLSGGRGGDDEPTEDVEVYDPGQNRWESFDGLDTKREGHGMVSIGTTLVALGGAGEAGALLGTAEAYDGDWEELSDWTLSPARARFGAVAWNGAVVLAGGFSALGPVPSVLRFELDASAPTPLPDLPMARGGLAAATDGTTMIVVGGRDASDAVLATVDRLGNGDGAWTALTPLPQAREGAVAVVLGTELIVAGGADAFGSVLNTVLRLPLDGVAVGPGPLPSSPALSLAGPNPTRGQTAVEFRLPSPGAARLRVVDALGRGVAVLLDETLGAGPGRVSWQADVPAGIYLFRLETAAGGASVLVTVAR